MKTFKEKGIKIVISKCTQLLILQYLNTSDFNEAPLHTQENTFLLSGMEYHGWNAEP